MRIHTTGRRLFIHGGKLHTKTHRLQHTTHGIPANHTNINLLKQELSKMHLATNKHLVNRKKIKF